MERETAKAIKRIAVDANPIISSLLRRGASYKIFFNTKYLFYTAEFTIKEVEKYLDYIAHKA